MKIRKLYMAVVCLGVICLCGCAANKGVSTQESSIVAKEESEKPPSKEEKSAIAEEESIMNNRAYLPISPVELKSILLENNAFLNDKSASAGDTSYIHLTNEKETMEIYLGNTADESTYAVSYRITENDPLQNEDLKKEILGTLQTVVECLNEEYNEPLLVDAITNAKIGVIAPVLEYSNDLKIQLLQEENYFGLDISAKVE